MENDTDLNLPDLNSADTALIVQTEDSQENQLSMARKAEDLVAVFDVPMKVSAVLGRAKMDISELLKVGVGTVIELDRKVGEAIDVYVNNRLVARGEVVLVEDKLGITMTEVIKSDTDQGV